MERRGGRTSVAPWWLKSIINTFLPNAFLLLLIRPACVHVTKGEKPLLGVFFYSNADKDLPGMVPTRV